MEKKQKPTLETMKELTKMEDENLQQVAEELKQRIEKREAQEATSLLPQTPLPHGGWKD